MMHNELALRSKAEIDAGFARIWQVMHDGIERGMNTEGAAWSAQCAASCRSAASSAGF